MQLCNPFVLGLIFFCFFLSVHIYTFSMNIQTFVLIDYRFLLHNFEGFFLEKKSIISNIQNTDEDGHNIEIV